MKKRQFDPVSYTMGAESGGGTSNYNALENKPSIAGVTLSGDKSASDLGLVASEAGKGLSTNDYSDADKAKLDNAVTGVKGDKEGAYRTGNVSLTPANIGAVPTSAVGTANGVAELDEHGIILAAQLPSYVDDVLEYAALENFPATGETGKIYVATSTNLTYRWTGTGYAEISQSIAIGETSSTAYRGDRGKIAYDHSQTTGNAHNMVKDDIGLGNVDNTSDASKPVSTPQQAALDLKVDKVNGKGLSTEDYTAAEKNKLAGIEAQANKTTIDATLSVTGNAADAKTTGDALALLRRLINGIDADCYLTATGNPAIFSDAKAVNAKNITVTITPTQSGTGDPSPSNIRPITGVSSVTVTRTGTGGANSQSVTVALTDGTDPVTVYNGTLDVTSGTLTVTSKAVDLGSLTWTYQDSYFRSSVIADGASSVPGGYETLCDIYASFTGPFNNFLATDNSILVFSYNLSANSMLAVRDTGYDDATSLKAALSGHYVICPLKTPVTHSLTAAQLQTLAGYNSVTTDAATLSVTYKADPSITLGGD